MRIAALLLVAALLLAGCSSSPEPDADTEDTDGPDVPADDGTDTGDDDGTPPATPPAPPVLTNAPPAAELTATAYEGTAPLDVTFLVDASDEDGDDLTFTLAFGDGSDNATGDVEGSASVNHTFEAEGTYTAVLAVFDGTAVTLANTTVVVSAAAAVDGPENWYWSQQSSAPDCISDFLIQDFTAIAADTSTCTFQAAGTPLELNDVATAQVGSRGWAASSPVAGSVYAKVNVPTMSQGIVDAGTITVTLATSDGTALGTATSAPLVFAADWVKYDFALTTAAEIPAGDAIILTLAFTGVAPGLLWSGGTDHPTGFAIGGPYVPA